MKWLLTMVCGALLFAGCMPCKSSADCQDGQTCSDGRCNAYAACSAGQTAPCVCESGAQGTQVCNADGMAFAACSCGTQCGEAGCATMPDLVGKDLDEAGTLLKDVGLKLPDPIDPAGFIIERRYNNPPVQILEQFPVAGAPLPKGTAPSLRVVMPPDQESLGLPNSSFLVGALSQDDEASAQAYYDAIDPDPVPTRDTLENWKLANGFGEPADDEASAVYTNRTDLGFGRHMHMRRKGNRVAFYVDNFPTLEDTIANTRMFATVAMEWSPPPDDPNGRPYTKFFTFNKKGVRIYDPALDSHGKKLQPAVCLACHGGTVTDLNYRSGGDLGAHFIPFDLDTLGYSSRPGYTRADQELAFKKFNEAIKVTYPADDPAYTPQDPAPVPELIDGWYGGPTHPSAYFDGTFVPPGWLTDDDSAELYLSVFAKTCRGCHMQREPSRNFSTYAKFWFKSQLIKQRVFEDGAMPLSEKGAQNFWLSYPSQPAILAAWLGMDFIGPGLPVARVKVAPSSTLRPGTFISLDGSDSQYTQTYSWTQTSGPAVTLSTNGARAFFSAPSPAANLEFQLITHYGELSSQPKKVTVFVVDSPSLPLSVAAAATGPTSALVQWTAPVNSGNSPLTSYKVVASPGGANATSSANTTQATLSGLVPGQTYTVSVTALNQAGLEGGAGTATVHMPVLPGAPTSVQATAGDAAAAVSWQAPSSDGGATISKYVVTASPGGLTASVTGNPAATALSFTGLPNGTSFTFTVVAHTVAGDGPSSTPSTAVTPATAPDPPTAVGAVLDATGTSAVVSWTASAYNGGVAIDQYIVTSSPAAPSSPVTVSNATACATTPCKMTFTGLTSGTSYTFTVQAHNIANRTSVPSAPSNAAYGPPLAFGSAPTVSNTTSSGTIHVAWTAPNDNGATITGNTVKTYTCAGTLQGQTATSTCSTGACSANVSGLTNGTSYKFTVTATNAGGNTTSGFSACIVPTSVPDQVTFSSSSITAGGNSLTASWSAPANNGSAITGYNLLVYVTGGSFVTSASVGASTFSKQFTGLKTCDYPNGDCNRTYTIYINAQNGSTVDIGNGAGQGPYNLAAKQPLVTYVGDNVQGIWSAPSQGCTGCHTSASTFPGFGAPQLRAYCDASYGTCTNTGAADQCGSCTSLGSHATVCTNCASRTPIYLCPSNTGSCTSLTSMGQYFTSSSLEYATLAKWVNGGNQF